MASPSSNSTNNTTPIRSDTFSLSRTFSFKATAQKTNEQGSYLLNSSNDFEFTISNFVNLKGDQTVPPSPPPAYSGLERVASNVRISLDSTKTSGSSSSSSYSDASTFDSNYEGLVSRFQLFNSLSGEDKKVFFADITKLHESCTKQLNSIQKNIIQANPASELIQKRTELLQQLKKLSLFSQNLVQTTKADDLTPYRAEIKKWCVLPQDLEKIDPTCPADKAPDSFVINSIKAIMTETLNSMRGSIITFCLNKTKSINVSFEEEFEKAKALDPQSEAFLPSLIQLKKSCKNVEQLEKVINLLRDLVVEGKLGEEFISTHPAEMKEMCDLFPVYVAKNDTKSDVDTLIEKLLSIDWENVDSVKSFFICLSGLNKEDGQIAELLPFILETIYSNELLKPSLCAKLLPFIEGFIDIAPLFQDTLKRLKALETKAGVIREIALLSQMNEESKKNEVDFEKQLAQLKKQKALMPEWTLDDYKNYFKSFWGLERRCNNPKQLEELMVFLKELVETHFHDKGFLDLSSEVKEFIDLTSLTYAPVSSVIEFQKTFEKEAETYLQKIPDMMNWKPMQFKIMFDSFVDILKACDENQAKMIYSFVKGLFVNKVLNVRSIIKCAPSIKALCEKAHESCREIASDILTKVQNSLFEIAPSEKKGNEIKKSKEERTIQIYIRGIVSYYTDMAKVSESELEKSYVILGHVIYFPTMVFLEGIMKNLSGNASDLVKLNFAKSALHVIQKKQFFLDNPSESEIKAYNSLVTRFQNFLESRKKISKDWSELYNEFKSLGQLEAIPLFAGGQFMEGEVKMSLSLNYFKEKVAIDAQDFNSEKFDQLVLNDKSKKGERTLEKSFAADLVASSYELFERLGTKEFRKTKVKTESIMELFLNFINSLSTFTTLKILEQTSLENAIKMYQFFVRVAYHAYEKRDFNTSYVIFSGLGAASINRLKNLIEGAKQDKAIKKKIGCLEKLFDPASGFKNYNKEINEIMNNGGTVIPMMGTLVQGLAGIEENNKDNEKGMVNGGKLEVVGKIIDSVADKRLRLKWHLFYSGGIEVHNLKLRQRLFAHNETFLKKFKNGDAPVKQSAVQSEIDTYFYNQSNKLKSMKLN